MSGQWRLSPSGAVMALDYGPLFERMKQLRLPDDQWQELFDNLRVVESAAIQTINDR